MDEGETGQNTGYIPVLVYTKSQAWHSEDSPGSPLAGDGRVRRWRETNVSAARF